MVDDEVIEMQVPEGSGIARAIGFGGDSPANQYPPYPDPLTRLEIPDAGTLHLTLNTGETLVIQISEWGSVWLYPKED